MILSLKWWTDLRDEQHCKSFRNRSLLIGSISMVLLFGYAGLASAQPEFYNDPFLGHPEFRVLPLRLPTEHPDSIRLEVHVRVVYDDLQFIKQDDHFEARYGMDILIKDLKDRLLGAEHLERSIRVESYVQTNSRQMGDQTRASFIVSARTCQLKVTLTDQESKKDRMLEQEISLAEREWQEQLRLGDVALLDSTGAADLNVGLLGGRPLRTAYHLYTTSPQTTLSYELMDHDERSIYKGAIALNGAGPLFADVLTLPTDSLPSRSYRLTLTARQGKTTLQRSMVFRLLWAGLPDYVQDLDLAIRQLKYVATDEEMAELRRAAPEKREVLFLAFWKRKDPTPNTVANERMEEYYRRVKYADGQFSGLRGGWETDMGKVYVIFGPPTDIERHPFEINVKPYEIWFYYDLNRRFIFVDEEGFGDYRLRSPFWNEF